MVAVVCNFVIICTFQLKDKKRQCFYSLHYGTVRHVSVHGEKMDNLRQYCEKEAAFCCQIVYDC